MSSAADTTVSGDTGTVNGANELVRARAVTRPCSDVVVMDAGLLMPRSTSPRWCRRGGDGA